jgi:hypothetical protein
MAIEECRIFFQSRQIYIPDISWQAKTNKNISSIRHLAYVILSKSLLQGHQLTYICKITGVMVKDLFESSHKPNESAGTKKISYL